MNSMGLRVEPTKVHYVICEITDGSVELISKGYIAIAKSLTNPDKLRNLRNDVISLLHEFKIGSFGLKTIENNAQSVNHFRLNAEGVLQELLSECDISNTFSGNIVELSGVFGVKRKDLKESIKNGNDLVGFGEFWGGLTGPQRECTLVSVASSKAK